MKELMDNNAKIVNVNNQESVSKRSFGYALNIKKAKAKLIKGAKRTSNLEIEVKTGCINLRFSGGAYREVVMPVLDAKLHKICHSANTLQ